MTINAEHIVAVLMIVAAILMALTYKPDDGKE